MRTFRKLWLTAVSQRAEFFVLLLQKRDRRNAITRLHVVYAETIDNQTEAYRMCSGSQQGRQLRGGRESMEMAERDPSRGDTSQMLTYVPSENK
jgi:hypothetical protein